MLHDILDDDHIQWHPQLTGHYTNYWPLLIWTLLPNLTFYLIVQGFHRTYATGAACQQRTLTPPDTWSCPTLGLACVLMSRPISPELVLSPDFRISNTPRYFSFAWWIITHSPKNRFEKLLGFKPNANNNLCMDTASPCKKSARRDYQTQYQQQWPVPRGAANVGSIHRVQISICSWIQRNKETWNLNTMSNN